jgi:DNA (cytosine-5)-methyltransferase 1
MGRDPWLVVAGEVLMRYLSVCSGIEAATVAWHPLGWWAAGFSEIEKFPSQVLAHHYPDVPNHGDMTNYKEWNLGSIDLLVGGTPCQSFSVAGLRKGMADPRGNLALVYCGILDHFRPKWFVWENVPGVLSSGGGRDFGSFLGAVGELGYGFAYRVLDAQWFGVAQRRRRVFVVGCLGDWRSAAAVLFERESLRRDIAPSREAGQKVAPTVVSGSPFSRTENQRVECDAIVPVADPAYCLETTCNDYSRADGFNMVAQPVACYGIPGNWIGRKPENGGNAVEPMDNIAPCLTGADRHGVASAMAVRRLTPTECERLQGFPDGYTDIQLNGKPTPDGPRYKALGNSMAVPVMRWIGQRIADLEPRSANP